MTDIPPGSSLVAYLRDSGGDSQELSLLQQEAEIRAECAEQGWQLTRVFRDEARPGSSTVGRDAFQEMIRYLRSGGQGEAGIIIWKFSRLSREIDSAQFVKADLRLRGYEFISLKDNVPSGPDGRLMESVIDWMNQRYLADLSSDVKRGQNYIATVHKAIPNSKTPFGYKREQVQIGTRRNGQPHMVSRFIPDPIKAPLVQKAYHMRAQGRAMSEIHKEVGLYRTLQGYSHMFRNQIYIGKLEWGESVIPDFCEPLIDMETWERVQVVNRKAELRTKEYHPRRARSRYLLSGLLTCGNCGRTLSGLTSRNSRKQPYSYYACVGRQYMEGHCHAPLIPMDTLDDLVLERIKEVMTTPQVLSELYLEARRLAESRTQERQEQEKAVNAELSAVRSKIRRVTEAITEHGHSRSLLAELGKLEADQERMEEKQAGILGTADAGIPDLEGIDLDLFGKEAWLAIEQASERDRQLLLRALHINVIVLRKGDDITGKISLTWLGGIERRLSL